jgi:hypothetical protein
MSADVQNLRAKGNLIKHRDITYRASPTLTRFHYDDVYVKTVCGPIGSGKSVGCTMDLLMKAHNQQPDEYNIRKTKWAIIRNTYRELIDTTMETFFRWIPKDTGSYSAQNLSFSLLKKLPDGTILDTEFLFRALDKPDDIKKLLSLDLTGAWINEIREVPKQVFDMTQGRCGRFPETVLDDTDPLYWTDPDNCRRLYGPTWHGVISDTNPPDSDHWYYKLFEEDKPDNYIIYHQPSGLAIGAENIRNLPKGYYKNMQAGKDQEWINVYVHGQYGFVSDGKPVYPEYKDDIHFENMQYKPLSSTIYVGIDFGLTPAAIFGQLTPSGRMIIFDELVTFDMGSMSFGKLLREKMNSKYPNHKFEIYADPAGEQRAQTDEVTPFQILNNQGIIAFPTYTNDFTVRREVVADYMQRLDFNGKPAFCITPGAPTIRKACAGGYKYKRMQVSGESRYMDKPDKGKYSHAADAGQYLFLGAVGGDRVVGGYGNQPIDYSYINKTIV